MREKLSPGEISGKLKLVDSKLYDKHEENLRSDLEIIAGVFPDIVEDAGQLYESMMDDDLHPLFEDDPEDEFDGSLPSDFIEFFKNPEKTAEQYSEGSELIRDLERSPNRIFYEYIKERYFSWDSQASDENPNPSLYKSSGLNRTEEIGYGLEGLLDRSFGIIRELRLIEVGKHR